MGLTYFKRYRMEYDLGQPVPVAELPPGYLWLAWSPALVLAHAETKFRSFKSEIDASVFPCLGNAEGCLRLMHDISSKEGFLSEATWLVGYHPLDGDQPIEYCGTIQGVQDIHGLGAVQNLGVVPEHRHKGLGKMLLLKALAGFRTVGLPRAYLEVTARNDGALRLYLAMGFRLVRTLYKVVDVAYS